MNNKKTITQWQKEVHQNAVVHGWWKNPRTEGELFMLIVSEVSEAFEEIRNNKGVNETYWRQKVLKKVISAIYIAALLVIVICTPLSAIFIVCKLCGASSLTWLGACVPLLVAIAALPFMILSKILLDAGNR